MNARMISKVKENFNNIDEKNKLVAILFAFGAFFIFLIDKFWISPDEYLYVSLGRNMANAYKGIGCLYCIDTAHTPLVSFLISLGYYFLNIDSIIFYRAISIVFIVGTLYFLFKIARIIYRNKRDAFWIFLIMLLFPGFFTFVLRVNLDIVALFFSSILIYLLLKKAKYWKIGLILVFIFLSKEYFVLFCGFVIFFISIIDAIRETDIHSWDKIKRVIIKLLTIFTPLLLIMLSFVVFSIFPYPRMLDNMLLEIFGNWYVKLGESIHHFQSAVDLFGRENLINITEKTDSINEVIKVSFWEKINSIYVSSYKEIDVNILVIPLVLIGLITRIKNVYLTFASKYDLARNDIVMLLILVVVSYFDYHVASGDHGFRIIIFLLIPYLYFIYWALKVIFSGKNYWINFFFAVFSIVFIFIYYQSNKEILIGNSLLSKNYLIAEILRYKVLINVFGYSLLAAFIFLYHKIVFKNKHVVFAIILMLFFLYKIMPFVADKYLSTKAYGNDYDLMLSRPYLNDIENKNFIILTNIKPYVYYYYSNTLKIPNVDRLDLPIIRKKPEIKYSARLISTDSLKKDLNISFLCQNKIDYILYVYMDVDDVILKEYIDNIPYIKTVKEYYLPANKRFNWGVYKADRSFCNK